jgi:alpha-glucoside transport system permease protein
LLAIFLLYPAVNTIRLSFLDETGQSFVGLKNYLAVLTSPEFLIVLRNNLLWLVFGTAFCVSLGLVFATLVDRVRREAFWKTWIFLPLAISAVGASVTWKFMYAYMPPNRPQIGLLNAVVTTLGGDPVAWLIKEPLNNLALIAIFIWAQTGFCMVILSAALKGVPTEIVEAARIDGANELGIFFKVLIPTIRGTIFTVTTTIVVAVLKVFDVVYTMTGGNYHTQVIANAMYQDFKNIQYGRSSALAVILLLAVLPVMIINVRNLREQRSIR